MGIDTTSLEAILLSLNYVQSKKNMLTLGRQGIHRPQNITNNLFELYNLPQLNNKYNMWDWCEKMFYDIGFEHIDSIDCSNYENATIIHDLNLPISTNITYDYIYDGGTIEHIFNTPQVCENIINLLSIGGIYCSVVPNNNQSGHGIYQFSPEFFLSAFSNDYGMKIHQLYIARVDTLSPQWINVNDVSNQINGRNCTSFKSLDEVYIITIAEKISNKRKNLILESPQQYSYENIDWKNK